MLEVKSREYQTKIEAAMVKGVMEASLDLSTKTIALLSGEIVAACANMIAMMAATSSVTSSPTKARQFCDELAKMVQKRIAEVKKLHAAGEMDWMTVVNAEDRH